MVRKKLSALLAVGTLALAQMPAQAIPIAAWEAGDLVAACSGYTCGVQFTAVNSVTVTALGGFESALFEDNGIVGLWDSGGSLLRSVTISSADTLIDGYLYETVASQVLTAGAMYTIGIWTGGSVAAGGLTPETANVSADLSVSTGVFSEFGGGFQLPTNLDTRLFGGANFLYEVQVPEPGTLGLLGVGLLALGFFRRRRLT